MTEDASPKEQSSSHDGCPGVPLQGRAEGAVTSVSIVDREHGCLTVQLGNAVVGILEQRARGLHYTHRKPQQHTFVWAGKAL